MYVVDRENHSVRRISGYNGADSFVTSVCGSEASESGWRDGTTGQVCALRRLMPGASLSDWQLERCRKSRAHKTPARVPARFNRWVLTWSVPRPC